MVCVPTLNNLLQSVYVFINCVLSNCWFNPGMLILVLVLVLKDSLRTYFKSWRSGPCPWGSGSCPCPGPCGSGPCPYPGPCGLVLVLVFSPCKDLFPLFRFIRILL